MHKLFSATLICLLGLSQWSMGQSVQNNTPSEDQILQRLRSVQLQGESSQFAIPWYSTAENCTSRAGIGELALRLPWTASDLNKPLVISNRNASTMAQKALSQPPTVETIRVLLTGPFHVRHGLDLYDPSFTKVLKSYSADKDRHFIWDFHDVLGVQTSNGVRVFDLSVSPTKSLTIEEWISHLIPAHVQCRQASNLSEYEEAHSYWLARTQFFGAQDYPTPDKECAYLIQKAFRQDQDPEQDLSAEKLTEMIQGSISLLENDAAGSLSKSSVQELIGNNHQLIHFVAPSKIHFLPSEKDLCIEYDYAFKFCKKYQ